MYNIMKLNQVASVMVTARKKLWLVVVPSILLVGTAALLVTVLRSDTNQSVRYSDDVGFDITGEDKFDAQIRALWQLSGSYLRARPNLDVESIPVTANVIPYGINTFLEQEVEVHKRERQVQIISDVGFNWIRQEFPWADIEVHA